MTKNQLKTKHCYSCDVGTVQPRSLVGRAFDYRDERGLQFDEDLTVPACDTCGELYLNTALTKRVSEVLERLRTNRKREAALRFMKAAADQFPDVSQARWEGMLGLSRGYLSRLASGARVADTTLEILLEAFARDSATVLDALDASGRLDDGLTAAIAAQRQRRGMLAKSARAPNAEEGQFRYEVFENPVLADRSGHVFRKSEGTTTGRRYTPGRDTGGATTKAVAA